MKSLPFLSSFLLMICIGTATTQGAPRVITDSAVLEGVETDGIVSFKGVPYARPPVGDLRWRAPQDLPKSDRVIKADHFGATPMQPHIWDDIIFRSSEMSEDCLYLNIWAPASGFPNAKNPVLVYIHGGGFAVGDGSEARYDGEAFARRGIVSVTINYRLGALGFLAHPELTQESPHHASGNYGLLDQNAALRWVRANIARFGGDPDRVTIAGQSAGSFSVSGQMASPLSKGLFQGAIGQSGAIVGPRNPGPLAKGEAEGLAFMKGLGADSIAQLRKLPAKQLIAAKHQPMFPTVVIDGYFLTKSPQTVFENGLQADVPLLAGWTTAESSYHEILGKDEPTRANFEAAVRKLYGEKADELLKLYAPKTDEDVKKVATDLATDRFMGHSTWKWLDLHAKSSGKPVFRYLYAQPLPGTTSGAPHSADLPYALGNLPLMKGTQWTDEDRRTSEIMSGYFVNFIKTGNPNGPGLPEWAWMQASIPHVLQIDANAKAIPEPGLKRFQYLDTLAQKD